MTTNQAAIYFIRHSAEGENAKTLEEMKAWMKSWGKSWVFQKECSDTGYIHWGGYVSLIKKRRESELKNAIRNAGDWIPMYLRPESDNGRKAGADTFYNMKADTRIEGPWSDKDKDIYIPRQYRGMENSLYPWQQKIWDAVDVFEPRLVNLVVDKRGNNGKSVLTALMELHGRGVDLPPINDGEKLIQSLADILISTENRNPRSVFIDIPRSMKQDKLFGLYAAIEQIKKGKVTDTRYSYKQWWFDSPQVWVFCNTIPDLAYLSKDRWQCWEISEEKDLLGASLE